MIQSLEKKENGKNSFNNILQSLGKKISSLFQPEEVEVTITGSGNNMSYTYTVIENK